MIGDGKGGATGNGWEIDTSSPLLLLRGPTLLLLSLTALILPPTISYLVATFLDLRINSSIILYGGAILGFILTINDALVAFQPRAKWQTFQSKIFKYGNELILDDLLKDLFAVDGLISCAFSSIIGTVLLYCLPLSKELRLRIIAHTWSWGSGGSNENQNIDKSGDDDDADAVHWIHQVVFQPGGIWKIVPNCNIDESHRHLRSTNVCREEGEDFTVAINPLDTDLELTLDGDDFDENDESSSIDHNNNIINPSTSRSTSTQSLSPVMQSTKPINVTERRQDLVIDTPEKIVKDAMQHIYLQLLEHMNVTRANADNTNLGDMLQKNASRFQTIGLVATISFLIQMRYSQTARRSIYNIAQGSVAVSLGSVAIFSLGSVAHCKKLRAWKCLYEKSAEWVHCESIETKKHPISRFNKTRQGIERLERLVQVLIYRFQHDIHFKRKWQGAIVMFILCCFRGHNVRNRNVQLSKSMFQKTLR